MKNQLPQFRRRVLQVLLLLLLGFCTDQTDLLAQAETCLRDTLDISTGWNYLTSGVYPAGAFCGDWIVTADQYAGTVEPRPAAVINGVLPWDGPLAGSQWISAIPTSLNQTNGRMTMEYCFCVSGQPNGVYLGFDILADDNATVYVNGTQIYSTIGANAFQINTGMSYHQEISAYLTTGVNCITVDVWNTDNVNMGLNLRGSLTAVSSILQHVSCCRETGAGIVGIKYNDYNCDGERDPDEPAIPGWQIVLDNGSSTMTTTTDSYGVYSFYPLSAGTYTVTEVPQSGWSQTDPTTSSHAVSLQSGEVRSSVAFGNCDTTPWNDCFEIRNESFTCDGNTPGEYTYQFEIRSLLAAPCAASSEVSFQSLGYGTYLTGNVGPFQIGNGWTPITLTITGPGATPGATILIRAEIGCEQYTPAGNIQFSCEGFLRDEIECPSQCEDCCDEFPKSVLALSSASSNGMTIIGGNLSAGTSEICTVSVSLLSAYVDEQLVPAQFLQPSTLGGPGNQGTIAFPGEITWTGIDVSTGLTPLSLRLKFPPMKPGKNRDRIQYCLRYRFTDRNCVTCDTVLCIQLPRHRGGGLDGAGGEKQGETEEHPGLSDEVRSVILPEVTLRN